MPHKLSQIWLRFFTIRKKNSHPPCQARVKQYEIKHSVASQECRTWGASEHWWHAVIFGNAIASPLCSSGWQGASSRPSGHSRGRTDRPAGHSRGAEPGAADWLSSAGRPADRVTRTLICQSGKTDLSQARRHNEIIRPAGHVPLIQCKTGGPQFRTTSEAAIVDKGFNQAA